MPDVIMADVIMADAPPLKRQRGDAVLVGKNIISSRILKYGYREHQVCFMLVAGKDRQCITKVNKTNLKLNKQPYVPNNYELKEIGKLFPPNFLHKSWNDFLYWDSELEP